MVFPLETRQATTKQIVAKNKRLLEEEQRRPMETPAKKVWILILQPSFLVAFSE